MADRERAVRLYRGDLRDAFDRVLRDHEVDRIPEEVVAVAPELAALPFESLFAEILDDLVDAAIDVRADR